MTEDDHDTRNERFLLDEDTDPVLASVSRVRPPVVQPPGSVRSRHREHLMKEIQAAEAELTRAANPTAGVRPEATASEPRPNGLGRGAHTEIAVLVPEDIDSHREGPARGRGARPRLVAGIAAIAAIAAGTLTVAAVGYQLTDRADPVDVVAGPPADLGSASPSGSPSDPAEDTEGTQNAENAENADDDHVVTGGTASPSVDDLLALWHAEEAVIVDCMADAGFEYQPDRLTGAQVSDPVNIGMRSPDQLRSFGYGTQLNESTRSQTRPESPTTQLNGLSTEQSRLWSVAFFGPDDAPTVRSPLPNGEGVSTSTVGCLAEAQARIYGSVGAALDTSAAEVVAGMARRNFIEDDAYMATLMRWFDCMSAAGYDLSGNVNGAGLAWEAYQRLSEAEGRTEEMRIASVDADCQEQVGLPRVQSEASDRLLAEAAEDTGFDLVGWQERRAQAIERAKAITGD